MIDPSQGTDSIKDVYIRDGKISLKPPSSSCERLSLDGLYLSPGFIDMHVHLRDPGYTFKEDIMSGCRAAAAGGVTSLFCMPNTLPVTDNADTIGYIKKTAENADARVYPVGALSLGEKGIELCNFSLLKKCGVIMLSDDGRPLEDASLMRQAMKRSGELGMIVSSHCEVTALSASGIMNEGEISHRLRVKGIPSKAEFEAVKRDISLAGETGARLHIQHVSCAGSIKEIKKAKAAGIRVTAETCPHYLFFTEDDLEGRNANFRMNPPLRTKADRQAVMDALCDGTIDVIATDHAPHTESEKADFYKAPNGVTGLETSFSAALTALYHTGKLSLPEIIELMSCAPARITGIPGGSLAEGMPADIAVFDPQLEWNVRAEDFYSRGKNSPFIGMTLKGRTVMTFLAGRPVYRI